VRRAWRIAAALGVVGVLTALTLVVTDTVRVDRSSPAFSAREPVRSAGLETSSRCRSQLSVTQPLRVWIGGDSLAGSLGPTLGELLAATGIVAPTWDSRISSGLSSPGFFDWPRHAADEMARLDPEVVVFIIGTNDWKVPLETTTDSAGALAWKARYAALVDQMLDVFAAEGRFLYWVGSPTLADPVKDRGIAQIDAVARSVVERHAAAAYFDAYQLFGDKDGQYSASLPGATGKVVKVRTDDGIHLTPAGAQLLATRLLGLVETRCALGRQADPDRPQRVMRTPGATQISGGEDPGTAETSMSSPSTTTAPGSSTTTTSPGLSTTLPLLTTTTTK
jgi:hypothetical protein